MWFRIRVKGLSAHGGTRYEGVSAIEKSQLLLSAILELEQIRNARITDPLYQSIPIPIPINIGRVCGGDWPSSVADMVIIEGRMGVAPDEKLEDARADFERQVAWAAENDNWMKDHPPTVEWFGAMWLPGQIDEEHVLFKTLSENYQSIMGEDPEVMASPWGTDGGLMQTVAEIPFIVFGPGATKVAHFSNEYIEIDKVMQCSQILAMTIVDWCGIE